MDNINKYLTEHKEVYTYKNTTYYLYRYYSTAEEKNIFNVVKMPVSGEREELYSGFREKVARKRLVEAILETDGYV